MEHATKGAMRNLKNPPNCLKKYQNYSIHSHEEATFLVQNITQSENSNL